MPFLAPGAAAVVSILVVEEAAALFGALRRALTVGIGVDVDPVSRALEQTLIVDRIANNIYIHRAVRKPVVPGEHIDPLLEAALHRRLDRGAVRLGQGVARLPAHAVVDLALARDNLVVAVVLEVEVRGPRLLGVLPDLVQRGGQVGGARGAQVERGRLALDAGVASAHQRVHGVELACSSLGHFRRERVGRGQKAEGGKEAESDSGVHCERRKVLFRPAKLRKVQEAERV